MLNRKQLAMKHQLEDPFPLIFTLYSLIDIQALQAVLSADVEREQLLMEERKITERISKRGNVNGNPTPTHDQL